MEKVFAAAKKTYRRVPLKKGPTFIEPMIGFFCPHNTISQYTAIFLRSVYCSVQHLRHIIPVTFSFTLTTNLPHTLGFKSS